MNHAGFSSAFCSSRGFFCQTQALSGTTLLWFFWQFVDAIGYDSAVAEIGLCTYVQDSTCLDQDEKRVMAIGRKYRNVRMLSKMPFDENGFV